MGGSYTKDGRSKDSRFETETSIPQDQWEDQELDGRMWFRGMHYNCWGQEDRGEEVRIEVNGGVL